MVVFLEEFLQPIDGLENNVGERKCHESEFLWGNESDDQDDDDDEEDDEEGIDQED
jgi:hypothetical protein